MTIVINGVALSARTVSYLETALWSSSVMLPCCEDDLDDDGCMDCPEGEVLHGVADGAPLDDHFGIEDCDPQLLRDAESDCNDFWEHLEDVDLLEGAYRYADDARIAHDFWLTRNGHGAGFWDGDYDGADGHFGLALTDAAKTWGGLDIYIGDDNRLHS